MNTENKHVHTRLFEPLDFAVMGAALLFVGVVGWLAWGYGAPLKFAMAIMVVGAISFFIVKSFKKNNENKKRNMAGVVVAVLAFALMGNVASAPAASAVVVAKTHQVVVYHDAHVTVVADEVVGMSYPDSVTLTCGWVTCSVYLTHWDTWKMQNAIQAWGGGWTGMTAACGLLALLTAPAAVFTTAGCIAVMAIYGGIAANAIAHAAADGGCLRIRFPIWGFYNDHSGYCHKS